jgi:ribosomal protein L40E
MKGPFRRIRPGRRPAEGPGQQQDPQATLVVPAAPAPPPEQPTAIQPVAALAAPAAGEPLPAGMAPADVAPTRPSFRDRGRLRRRLRYLRRVRELGFRDLGGLAFDLHRFRRRNDELVLGKLAALDAVDRELRAIERVLDDRRDIVELREPGVAACPRCGALHGSDANFCPQCGTQFSGPLAMVEVGGVPAAPAPPAAPAAAPVEVSPAQEVLPFSASEQGTTPVSGALAGNPPPPAPAEEPVVAEPAAPGGQTAAPGGDAVAPGGDAVAPGGEAADAPTRVDQPTQAFPAVERDADADAAAAPQPDGNGHDRGSAMTSGDPLASRERSAE